MLFLVPSGGTVIIWNHKMIDLVILMDLMRLGLIQTFQLHQMRR
jgi:hypothetical protein